jgi:hypothetical protein
MKMFYVKHREEILSVELVGLGWMDFLNCKGTLPVE